MTAPVTDQTREPTGQVILDISDLTVSFRGQQDPTLSQVSLQLRPGRIHGLVGQSGSGKSLLASAVLGLLPSAAAVRGGSIGYDPGPTEAGVDIARASERELAGMRGTGIGMIFQNPLTTLDPTLTIGRHFSRITSRRDSDQDGTPRDWLARAGFEDPDVVLRSYPHELSGGMRQRAVIALVCSSMPRVIIADEPTTALDTVVQKQVLDLLRSIVDETGVALLLITHDFDVIRYLTDDVTVLRDGKVVESGLTATVTTTPEHSYTRELLAAVPGRGTAPVRVPAGPGDRDDGAHGRETLLSVRNLTKEYTVGGWASGYPRQRRRVVDDVNLDIRRGEIYAVIGRSGSGKSTLARLLGDLVPRTAGKVEGPGRAAVQYVFQDPSSSLNPVKTVGAQISRPLRRYGLPADPETVGAQLEQVGLDGSFASRYPLGLSGGEAQRACFARALAPGPELLILDEPTSALDVLTQRKIISTLLEIRAKRGLTCVFIAHSLGLVEWVADRVGVMDGGRLVDEFPVADLRSPSRSTAVQALIAADLSRQEN
ncbi:Glutathione import ATP-binding protein GsiA [Corynebacterium provencense]|uniref:Glutathione import ATP-binding protein GsiA n=1 Tax=Corynebacterium provencense TaxID=1737425 RepID=A0A2Z3YQ21_9CORY|nr:ABC transporter ATP-binding protein [Corynebacterium provencense]AWT26962.1 Glutathione import ATP-binding protein GsiA [Corynebacterium provencense]